MKVDKALLTIEEIDDIFDLGVQIYRGDAEVVTGPAALQETHKTCISFSKPGMSIPGPYPAILILKQAIAKPLPNWSTLVYTARPKYLFALFCTSAFPESGVSTVLREDVRITDGFGWVRHRDGAMLKFPHYGSVKIGSGCDISPLAAIARGSLTDTEIGSGVKVDNFVHVAHGARIGDHTSIAAGTVIEGSVEVGKRCTIGGNVTFQIGSSCGDDVTVGSGSVVTKHIPDGETWAGVPARKLK